MAGLAPKARAAMKRLKWRIGPVLNRVPPGPNDRLTIVGRQDKRFERIRDETAQGSDRWSCTRSAPDDRPSGFRFWKCPIFRSRRALASNRSPRPDCRGLNAPESLARWRSCRLGAVEPPVSDSCRRNRDHIAVPRPCRRKPPHSECEARRRAVAARRRSSARRWTCPEWFQPDRVRTVGQGSHRSRRARPRPRRQVR